MNGEKGKKEKKLRSWAARQASNGLAPDRVVHKAFSFARRPAPAKRAASAGGGSAAWTVKEKTTTFWCLPALVARPGGLVEGGRGNERGV